MSALGVFRFNDFFDTLVSLTLALVLGAVIGAERQYRQRNAGLRTNALVALGAAAFVDLAMSLNGAVGAAQVAAYVVSGVGFLGAGVIMKDGGAISGLNTAATLWSSAAVGAFAGTDHAAEAIALTLLVLAGNTFLRPVVRMIERAPVDRNGVEATYELRAICHDDDRDVIRDKLEAALRAAHYPIRDLETDERPDGEVEIIAILAVTSVDPAEMAQLTAKLGALPEVRHAAWTSRLAD